MTTYYISGRMRGLPDYNKAQFDAVEKYLWAWVNEQPGLGDHVITNPRNGFGGDVSLPPTVYLTKDLQDVLEADVIILIEGWQASEGANREAQLGVWTGKQFMRALPKGDNGCWIFEPIDEPEFSESIRAQACDIGKALITGDRNNAYGPPHQDFQRTADAMSAYGYRHTQLPLDAPTCPTCGARRLQSHDTAISIDCVKTSRLMWTPNKADSWDDKIGYAACGKECAHFDEEARLTA
jgi:hypothetical protein